MAEKVFAIGLVGYQTPIKTFKTYDEVMAYYNEHKGSGNIKLMKRTKDGSWITMATRW